MRSVVRVYPGPLPLANSQRKSEIRISKSETNSNVRSSNVQNAVLNFGNLNFDIVSDLGFRIWDFREAGSGDVAQLGERRLCKPEVVGSSPIVSIVGSA